MLRQPKATRVSFVREVLDVAGDEDLLTQIWMLRRDEHTRESYVREVLEPHLWK